ncbi:MAG: hypothetical protein QOF27_1310 [Gaiellaceae bacterium]|nr:hypothetical protein [Gaiellaceae bacterium]
MRGLELSRRFYFDAVRPIVERAFGGLEHTAALIGHGSEVLGFDDERSQDHQWGPRVQLFLRDLNAAKDLKETLAHELPTSFAGFSTHFGPTEEAGTVAIADIHVGPVNHAVETLLLGDYVRAELGVNPLEGFEVPDWLATPTQRLLEFTSGEVFCDPIGELTQLRERLAWYPHDVWLLVMAAQWRRVGQLEHFVGRTGSRGDDLGSRVIAAWLVRDLMRLALLQERRYPPYWKWLGSAYAQLNRPEAEALAGTLAAGDWQAREAALVEAYEAVAGRHNELGVTEPVDPNVRAFWGRPFQVLFADRFVDSLRGAITDPAVRAIDHEAGSVDAISDNTDFLDLPRCFRELTDLYDRA